MGANWADAGGEPLRGRLLERETELAVIEEALTAAEAVRGNVLAIVGPAGIGKSRLLDAAVAVAGRRQIECFVARGGVSERDYPISVALQLFERRARGSSAAERDALFAEAAGLAAPLLAPTGGDVPAAGPPAVCALVHGL